MNAKDSPGKLLSVIPDAPRTSVTFPPSWDWSLLQSSARSTLNIPQLVNTGLTPERKSVSDYDVNGLRPPVDARPDFLVEARQRIYQPMEQKVVTVEEKIFNDSDVNHAQKEEEVLPTDPDPEPESEPEPEPEPEEEQEEEVQEEPKVESEPEPELEPEPEPEPEPEAEVEEPEVIMQQEAEVENGLEPSPPVDGPLYRPALEEETRQAEEKEEPPEPAEVKTEPIEPESGETVEEPYDEKTEREIAEERQRLMDEGLLKVEEDDDDEDSESEREINEIIHNGDMQGLANLVLEGQGSRLLGKKSENPEIQGFLDNVPSYIVSKNLVV